VICCIFVFLVFTAILFLNLFFIIFIIEKRRLTEAFEKSKHSIAKANLAILPNYFWPTEFWYSKTSVQNSSRVDNWFHFFIWRRFHSSIVDRISISLHMFVNATSSIIFGFICDVANCGESKLIFSNNVILSGILDYS